MNNATVNIHICFCVDSMFSCLLGRYLRIELLSAFFKVIN